LRGLQTQQPFARGREHFRKNVTELVGRRVADEEQIHDKHLKSVDGLA
jgi:hypothetical protein